MDKKQIIEALKRKLAERDQKVIAHADTAATTKIIEELTKALKESKDTSLEGISQIKGDKGDTGEIGPVGPQGEIGPIGPQGEKGEVGKDGKNGRMPIVGIDFDLPDPIPGTPGKDGSPDTPQQIADKVNTLDKAIKSTAIDGLLTTQDVIKELKGKSKLGLRDIEGMPLNFNDQRWHGGGTTSPLTTKGDVWGYSTTDARIPVGTNGQVLTVDSTQALGVKWATASGGVTSVSNVDGTLTISPTTGAVVASLNLAHANSWSGVPTFLNGFRGGFWFPTSNSTTALQLRASNGTTVAVNVDTANLRVGIKTTTPRLELDVTGSIVATNSITAGPLTSTNGSIFTYGTSFVGFVSRPAWSSNGFLFTNSNNGTGAFVMGANDDIGYFGHIFANDSAINLMTMATTHIHSSIPMSVGTTDTSTVPDATFQVKGNFHVTGTLVTIGDVGSMNATINYGSGNFTADGSTRDYLVFAYKTVGAGRVYSVTPASSSASDDSSFNPYYIALDWSGVGDAEGYKILRQVNGLGFGEGWDVGNTTSANDGDGSEAWTGDVTVTPNSAYLDVTSVILDGIPTSSAGLTAGMVWNNGGALSII